MGTAKVTLNLVKYTCNSIRNLKPFIGIPRFIFLLHLYLGNRLIGYHIKLKINNGFRCAATELRNKVEDIRVCQWLSLSSEEDS